MDVRREELRAGLHRAKGVLNWQGIPENHPVRESLHHFRKIVVELDRCFEDASREQLDALRDAYDRVSRSLPELLRNRSEDELSTREDRSFLCDIDRTRSSRSRSKRRREEKASWSDRERIIAGKKGFRSSSFDASRLSVGSS